MEENETVEKAKTNWAKIGVIALAGVLALMLIAGVAFAVARGGSGNCGRSNAAAVGGTSNGTCNMGTGDCAGQQNGECTRSGECADGQCTQNGQCSQNGQCNEGQCPESGQPQGQAGQGTCPMTGQPGGNCH